MALQPPIQGAARAVLVTPTGAANPCEGGVDVVHDTQPATTLAYVAGLIDGEGSISIGVSRDHPGRATPNYWLQVSVTNTDRTLIDWLLTSFGGHTSSNSHYHDAPKRRPCWAWRVM